MTSAQLGVWTAQQLDAASPRYNCGSYIEIHGRVDSALMSCAVGAALQDAEALRVSFVGEEQRVDPVPPDPLEFVDTTAAADPRAAAETWMLEDLSRPVDLEAGPLVRHALIRHSDISALLYLRYHHVVMDGFGQTLHVRRLAEIYTALVVDRAAPASQAATLAELIAEDERYAGSAAWQRDRDHWLKAFGDRAAAVSLSEREPKVARSLLRRSTQLGDGEVGLLRQAAKRLGTRPAALLIAAAAAYQCRITCSTETILNLPVPGRTTPAARSTPSMLANELPLRVAAVPGTSFVELVAHVSRQLGKLLRHQRYRGEQLHRDLGLAGDARAIAGTTVNVFTFDESMTFAGLPSTAHHLSSGPVKDLQLDFFTDAQTSRVRLVIDANPERYTPAELAGHGSRLLTLLRDAMRDPQRAIAALHLMEPEESKAVATASNGAVRDYDLSRGLHDLVEAQAARTPGSVAVQVENGSLTYHELVGQARALAAYLRDQGAGPGRIVGVHADRSLELVVQMLGVLLSGAAYLPLDPEVPAARLTFQIEDAGVSTVLSSSRFVNDLRDVQADVVAVDTLLPELPAHGPLPALGTPGDTAYVIYTSGSTGRPKGVAVPHRGVVNRLLWMQEEYGLKRDDRVLQKTAFTFDVSVWELFWPLICGARLHLAEPGAHRDPRAMADVVRRHAITTMHFVPSMLDLFLAESAAAELDVLRRVICSGEALRPQTIARFFQVFGQDGRGPELHNLYGPTEASIDVTSWRCSPADAAGPVPIGRAVANTAVHVLGPSGEPLPFGVIGELHIGGVQVATGYVNRPELTAERFVAGPSGEGVLYRTGDRAELREDGVVLYHGRLDDQVKVRGHRIEPGEVESALLAQTDIAQAVVTAPERADGSRELVAHIVEASAASDQAELFAALRDHLPAYMIPARIVVLDALPMLPSGKIDRKALPSAAPTAVSAGSVDRGVRSVSTDEALLEKIWSGVLGLDVPGLDDSFFALGGDSMLAIRMRAEVERHGRTFTVGDLFERPTIRELAAALRPMDEGDAARPHTQPFGLLADVDRARLPDGLDDAYPLAAMQAAMLYHVAVAEGSSVYRVVTSTPVAEPLDLHTLGTAVADTVRRHPSLRCSFDLTHYSEPLQLVHREVNVPVERAKDLSALDPAAQDETIRGWIELAKFTRFDPAVPPLLRFAVHRRGAALFQLSVVEHHVVLDGWSDVRMLEEVLAHYRARRSGEELWLPEVASTYRDFVAAERRALADEASCEYWSTLLAGVDPAPLAPERGSVADDDRRPAGSSNRRFEIPIPDGLTKRLRSLARQEGLPLKALLIAAHLAVLRLVGGQDEVLTGSVTNARLEEHGGDEVIGVFLNTLPLRVDLGELTLIETARRVFDEERRAAPHRRYPFSQMHRDIGEGLRIDAYVNFMDFGQGATSGIGGSVLTGVGVAETEFPLAVDFLVDPESGGLELWLDCDLAVLPEELCARLTGYYRRALHAVADSPEADAATIDLLDDRELALMQAWNHTATAYDGTATVHGMIERQARLTPGAGAVAHRWSELTYTEFDARANRLARHLHDIGVRRGDLVGVSLRRGTELIVALLAVMKTGGAYVPLDPSFPSRRLEDVMADAGIACLVTERGGPNGITAPLVVHVDDDRAAIAARPANRLHVEIGGEDVAYVMYTSGTTGEPKGIPICHRNVLNFFAGMDGRVGADADEVVLALTSVSFDISVLELLWPLTHGAKVVVAGERLVGNLVAREDATDRATSFSLFFFAATAGGSGAAGYSLLLDAARFADSHGFEAIWTPERHFHEFGGLYPNPAVMAAALATITENVALRCGSVVAPLHDSIRIAEEWSLVDNLSNGRVGLAFASGWNSNDFVFFPERYATRKRSMADQLSEFRRLWRGECVQRTGGSGETVDVRIFPAPVQDEPPVWLTSVGTVQTFQNAGAAGVNLLTHLLGQSPDELTEKIAAYRRARAEHGHPSPGQVTVMVHTFMLGDAEEAKRRARGPFRAYLRSSTELWRTLFATTGQEFPESGAEEYLDVVIDQAIERYFGHSGLFGSPETCAALVRTLGTAGVDEIACLIDFGMSDADALEGLTWIDRLRDAHEEEVAESRHSFAELCRRHAVTLVQGTPSMLSAVASEPAALESLASARALLVGGEAFPSGLAQRFLEALPGARIFNMYGPTETTIWSTVHELERTDADAGAIPIGRPIANTAVAVMDSHGRPVPVGVAGELWIGGDGIAVGYLGRPELTAERFVMNPDGGRFYRTGDRVRWTAEGTLEFLGRLDRQVKILGHRVEPDEVESMLSRHPALDAVAITAVAGPVGTELIAFVSPAESVSHPAAQDGHVSRWQNVWDNTYAPAGQDGTDFAGWNSSYTGEPIPELEMREWLQHTIGRIRELRPTAVADVGVGTGLLLRELVGEIDEYHGLDISDSALSRAAQCLGSGRDLPANVRLVRSGPEYLVRLEPGSLDTVVLNSVVQYFPGADYLEQVLCDAVRGVRTSGAVFVGDVRAVELLPEFHASVQLHRVDPLQTIEEIRSTVARGVRDEDELCLSPVFFTRLAAKLDGVCGVRIELKRGRADNELTRFRYDVTLLVGEAPRADLAFRQLDWNALVDGMADVERHLKAQPTDLVVSGIPNVRLVRPVAVVEALGRMDAHDTAWDLDRELWGIEESAAVHPEHVVDMGLRTGRRVRLLVPPDGRLDRFDAVFGSPQETT